MAKSSKRQPSVLNWMGSLILYAIPGVNLIFLALSVIFAKSTGKRNFAIAGLLLILFFTLLTFVSFMVFQDYFVNLAQTMRDSARPVVIGEVVPVA